MDSDRQWKKCLWHTATAVLVTVCAFPDAATEHLGLYDSQDNLLLTADFNFDNSGKLTSREVMAPDGYFLRSSSLKRDGAGRITQEQWLNYNGQQIAEGAYSYGDSKVTYSLIDDGRPRAEASYPAGADRAKCALSNTGGMSVASVDYLRDTDGTPIRVELRDAAGKVLYYARLSSNPISGVTGRGAVHRSRIRLWDRGHGVVSARFTIDKSTDISLQSFNSAGRIVARHATDRYPAGTHTLTAGAAGGGAPGLYLVVLRVGDRRAIKRILVADKPAGRPTTHARSPLTKTLDGYTGAAKQAVSSESSALTADVVSPGFLLGMLALNGDLATTDYPRYSNPSDIVVSSDGSMLYVAERRAKRIALIDADTRNVLDHILLPNEPTGLALTADNATLYVTCSSERWPSGMLYPINTESKQVGAPVEVGFSAREPVLSPDEKRLYTCNVFVHTVSVVDLEAGNQVNEIKMVREPYAAAITPDGGTLVVTNNLPIGKAAFDDDDTISALISFVDLASGEVTSKRLTDGSHSLHGLSLTPDGKYGFATHVVGRYKFPANRIQFGWINSNNISILDVEQQKVLNVIDLDESTHGVANPWDAALTADGKRLCISHAGSAELTVVDVPGLLTKIQSLPSDSDLTRDLAFARDVRTRIHLRMHEPQTVEIHGDLVYIAGYLADSIAVVRLDEGTPKLTDWIALGNAPQTQERKGAIGFGDATQCFQQWQSCRSCHPFTRPDMLNWDLQKDGLGNPRNAKSMLWAHRTPPAHSDGGREDAGVAVRAGISFEQFTTPDETRATAIDTFLARLKPYPSPHLTEKGKLTERAKLGKELFENETVDCGICHISANRLYTDQERHTTGTGKDPTTGNTDWDTPTLIEVWRTAPYGHEGQYATMADLLRVPGHTNASSVLTTEQFQALMEYMSSL